MKNLLPLVLGLCLMTACTQDTDDLNNQTNNVTSGNWRVSQFIDSGNDETSDFSGFTFQFGADSSVTATRNSVSTSGTWSLSSNSQKLNLNLGPKTNTNKPLGELTDDWKIISISDTEIKLADDNTASAESVTFVKN